MHILWFARFAINSLKHRSGNNAETGKPENVRKSEWLTKGFGIAFLIIGIIIIGYAIGGALL